MYWRQKDGSIVKVRDMTESHIQNCIKMLKRTMPDHDEDVTVMSDLEDYHMATFAGAKRYKRNIAMFNRELERSKLLQNMAYHDPACGAQLLKENLI